MPFELLDSTPATIVSVTPRTENHGDEKVPALSIGLKLTMPNTVLDILAPGLMAMLYKSPDVPDPQSEIAEAQVVSLPLLRSAAIDQIELKHKLEGWRVEVEFGIDDTSAIVMSACKIDKVRATPLEGGSCVIRLRIGSSELDDSAAGRLWALNGSETNVRILAPAKKEEPIDGSRDGDFFAGSQDELPVERDATDIFADRG